MSDLTQFVTDAIKTESKIDKVVVNNALLSNTIEILINAGNILDQMKKHIFYGKEYNLDDLMMHLESINVSTTDLNNLTVDNIIDDETELKVNPRIFHSIVGISTEATELLEALDINVTSIDTINIGEEFGDIDWYKAIGCDELDIDWDTILDAVIEKLKTRYPNKFTSEDAINRNLDKEREVLDKIKT